MIEKKIRALKMQFQREDRKLLVSIHIFTVWRDVWNWLVRTLWCKSVSVKTVCHQRLQLCVGLQSLT
jgi:hypothetical protein